VILLNIDFVFPENGLNTVFNLTERVEIKGNPLLIAYFASIMKKTHLQTFENLRKQKKRANERKQPTKYLLAKNRFNDI
jgi:hypothetical protein